MPGKVNPVIPEVVDPGRRPGDRQRRRDHARRHPGPVRAQRPGAADRPQPARLDQAARRRLPPARHQVRAAGSSRTRRCSSATPSRRCRSATALNPHIGYDKATEIVKEAASSNRTVREVASERGRRRGGARRGARLRADGAAPRLSASTGPRSRPRRSGSPAASAETPVLELEPDALGLGLRSTLKLELHPADRLVQAPRRLQRAARAPTCPTAGIVAASGGNFGLAAATAAAGPRHPGGDLRPRGVADGEGRAPAAHGRRCARDRGALRRRAGRQPRARGGSTGALEVHAFDDPAIVAGQGTCGARARARRPRRSTRSSSASAAAGSAPGPRPGSASAPG